MSALDDLYQQMAVARALNDQEEYQRLKSEAFELLQSRGRGLMHAAGWGHHPDDPVGRSRYFDGNAWTEETRAEHRREPDSARRPRLEPFVARDRRDNRNRAVFGRIIVVVGLLIGTWLVFWKHPNANAGVFGTVACGNNAFEISTTSRSDAEANFRDRLSDRGLGNSAVVYDVGENVLNECYSTAHSQLVWAGIISLVSIGIGISVSRYERSR